jgi:hypothetical protein
MTQAEFPKDQRPRQGCLVVDGAIEWGRVVTHVYSTMPEMTTVRINLR